MENDSVLDLNHTPEGEYKLAGFWIRVGASVLDSLILIPIIALNMYVLYTLSVYITFFFVRSISMHISLLHVQMYIHTCTCTAGLLMQLIFDAPL